MGRRCEHGENSPPDPLSPLSAGSSTYEERGKGGELEESVGLPRNIETENRIVGMCAFVVVSGLACGSPQV